MKHTCTLASLSSVSVRRWLVAALGLAFTVAFAVFLLGGSMASGGEGEAHTSGFERLEAPQSSPLDTRQYGSITLTNGLTVTLISDTTASTAAAALDVHVGSQSDPRNASGLAHFLEHMLFQGR